ncbi:hypothetical protein Cpin_4020 [Chitinophaga pinensis DSM 2588]|uniref:Uncharacterized protein n=1 Tax=Chitinophaga pinensis (strain ATCC 43595 / DSM 2588 / LMG 13176 / NBRC 15968 / NCIMB 11800 / UQM 2034) TaxID=485918 RepID=A0A979G691_CHIPD|nr:hypothetical protein Cpin_4020 [Chitinophaga pinensis DSM 2588]
MNSIEGLQYRIIEMTRIDVHEDIGYNKQNRSSSERPRYRMAKMMKIRSYGKPNTNDYDSV